MQLQAILIVLSYCGAAVMASPVPKFGQQIECVIPPPNVPKGPPCISTSPTSSKSTWNDWSNWRARF